MKKTRFFTTKLLPFRSDSSFFSALIFGFFLLGCLTQADTTQTRQADRLSVPTRQTKPSQTTRTDTTQTRKIDTTQTTQPRQADTTQTRQTDTTQTSQTTQARQGGLSGEVPCGGLEKETFGVITSPDFPGVQRGVSLGKGACRWIIQGGKGKQINVFLTEIYAKSTKGIFLTAHEIFPVFSDFENFENFVKVEKNATNLGGFNIDNTPEIPIIRTRKPYLVISAVPDYTYTSTNNNTISSLQDLRGFNVTYRISSLIEDIPTHRAHAERGMCSHRLCTYAGRCVIGGNTTAVVIDSRCVCLPDTGHTGSHCQYGPACDPTATPPVNPCANQGVCRYSRAGGVPVCQCPPSLTGALCDTWREGALPDCSLLECEEGCGLTVEGVTVCKCHPGRHLNEDKKSCSALTVRQAVPPSSGPAAGVLPSACRYLLRGLRGVIQTPGFPKAFHTPIDCEWVIEVGGGKDTMIYFTELYLAPPAFLRISSYESYAEGRGVGETPLLSVEPPHRDVDFDYDRYPDGLNVSQPVIVVRMRLKYSHTMLRVKYNLLNEFGFNMTYIAYPRGSSMATRLQGCMGLFSCSVGGRCLVDSAYLVAKCVCADGLFGDRCQYGPRCNPLATPPETPCLNGGLCQYYFGSSEMVKCECLAGFGGARCEMRVFKADEERREGREILGCEGKNCSQRCLPDTDIGRRTQTDIGRLSQTDTDTGRLSQTNMRCACHPGFRLDDRDNRTCLDTGRKMVRVDVDVKRGANSLFVSKSILKKFANFFPKIENCKTEILTENNITLTCLADGDMITLLEGGWGGQGGRGVGGVEGVGGEKVFGGREIWNVSLKTFPVLDLVSLSLFSKTPVAEKSEIALVCVGQGSPSLKFFWAKDGLQFEPGGNPRMWLTEMPLPPLGGGRKSCQVNIENVKRAHQGVYTCTVEDEGEMVSQSVIVEVMRTPSIIVLPSTPSVQRGQSLALTCTTTQSAVYRWQRGKGEDVKYIPGHYTVEVQPLSEKGNRGLQLFIENVTENSEYTCTAVNSAGKKRERFVKIRVLLPNDPICSSEYYKGVWWGVSLADTENEEMCPFNFSGFVKRRCNSVRKWEEPDFSDCVSVKILSLKTIVDGMQVGFGGRRLETFRAVARDVRGFVVSQRPLFSKDLQTALELLDTLRSLSVTADMKATELNEVNVSLTEIFQLLVEKSEKTNRFSLPFVEKEFFDEKQKRVFSVSGKFFCDVTKKQEFFENENFFSRYKFDCPIIATPPGWLNTTLSLQRDDWSPLTDLLVPEVTATVTEVGEGAGSTDGHAHRLASNVVELMFFKFDSILSNYFAHFVFDLSVSDLLTVLGQHKFSSDSSVIHDAIECVEKNVASVEWTGRRCRTVINGTLFLMVPVTIVTVHCFCRLSKERAHYAVRIMDNSTSWSSGTSRFLTSPSYIMPVIVVASIGVLVLLGVALFCWQRKKILSCLLRFKKRTCDFVAQNLHTSQAESSAPSEIPMTRRDVTGAPPPDEMTSLVRHFPLEETNQR